MKRVLVVESDEEQSRKLSEAIEARGEYAVSKAATVREACLLIAAEPFDLAFIPGAEVTAARQALHSMAPELDLAVIMPGEPVDVPDLDAEALRGVVFTDALAEGLRELLGEIVEQPTSTGDNTALDAATEQSLAETQVSAPTATAEETLVVGTLEITEADEAHKAEDDRAHRVLESVVGHEQILGGVLMSAGDISDYAGELTDEQAISIARRVSLTWRGESTALLQFIRLPKRVSDLLLFTRSVEGPQLLTLAAKPDYDVSKLRRAADDIARELLGAEQQALEGREIPAIAGGEEVAEQSDQLSFALLFQPRRPMPAAMRAAVSKALYDVAEEAGLNLHFQQVDGELVHLVTTCPLQQGSGWLARLYKQGVEERIQDQFGIPAQMWRKGFYATESELPLSDAELKLFTKL